MNVATCGADSFDRADHHQRIIEMRRAAIFDVHFGDGIGALARFMHHALVDADTGQHVRPRALHEMQIARVIDDARKIGVLEIDAHGE